MFTLELITEICTSYALDPEKEDYVIYPNPVSQVLFVSSPDREPFELMVYGISGNLIWKDRDQSEYQIDVQGYLEQRGGTQGLLQGRVLNPVVIAARQRLRPKSRRRPTKIRSEPQRLSRRMRCRLMTPSRACRSARSCAIASC